VAATDIYGGSYTIQIDPVVDDFLRTIQDAQHAHDDQRADDLKRSLVRYVSDYQVKAVFRQLPDWARP
jgi:hypothetical protein